MAESLYRPGWFRVGIAADPQPEDKICDTEQEAIARGRSLAEAQGYTTAVAVWDQWNVPLHIFMLGSHFRRT